MFKLLHCIPSRGPALVLFCVLSTACASGGAGTIATGSRTARVTTSTTFGVGVFDTEITTEPSVQETVIPELRSAVWSALPSVFETLGIEIPTVDPISLVVGNPGYNAFRVEGQRLSTYLDCGIGVGATGPYADAFQVTLQLMVQLERSPDGGTLVRTVMDAYARPRNVSGNSLHCVSKRTLERRIVELITAELAGDVILAGDVTPGRNLMPSRVLTPVAQGNRPVAGDLLRVECFSPQAQEGRIAEGLFEGAGGGELLLSVGLQSQRVAVPVVTVTRVEVRRRRSRSREGAIIGLLLGAVAGAVYLDSKYESEREAIYNYHSAKRPKSSLHFRREIYPVVGGIAGALVGLALGASTGSFIMTDVWLEVPQNWVVRYSESASTTPEEPARAMACLSPDTDTR